MKTVSHYRIGRQNRFGMFLVIVVVLLLLLVVSVKGFSMKAREAAYRQQEETLQTQIEEEMQRSKDIEAFRKYTQTKKYIEEVAKDKLGLVYEGEIVFSNEDKK